jgi:hypothetical protein
MRARRHPVSLTEIAVRAEAAARLNRGPWRGHMAGRSGVATAAKAATTAATLAREGVSWLDKGGCHQDRSRREHLFDHDCHPTNSKVAPYNSGGWISLDVAISFAHACSLRRL